jgi:phosphatidylserine/phosphatidylglycerophosphate/cardiolipin synthase-like enzyme
MKIGLSTRTFRQPALARPSYKPRDMLRHSSLNKVGGLYGRLHRVTLDSLAFLQHRHVTAVWIVVPSTIGAGAAVLWLFATPTAPTQYGRSATPSQSQILYAPLANLEVADEKLIGSARWALNVAAYSLTDGAIIETLIAAKHRGVVVRIVLDRSQLHANERFSGLFDDIRVKRAGPIMHLKSYSVDGGALRTGSANLSHGGLLLQDNDLVVSQDPVIVGAFDQRFEEMWAVAEPLSEIMGGKAQKVHEE